MYGADISLHILKPTIKTKKYVNLFDYVLKIGLSTNIYTMKKVDVE